MKNLLGAALILTLVSSCAGLFEKSIEEKAIAREEERLLEQMTFRKHEQQRAREAVIDRLNYNKNRVEGEMEAQEEELTMEEQEKLEELEQRKKRLND